jgi:hypothetical protein
LDLITKVEHVTGTARPLPYQDDLPAMTAITGKVDPFRSVLDGPWLSGTVAVSFARSHSSPVR